MKEPACRNCRRPLHWVDGIGWLHGELPQYASRSLTCERPEPVCSPPSFTRPEPGCMQRHLTSPIGDCPCACHKEAA